METASSIRSAVGSAGRAAHRSSTGTVSILRSLLATTEPEPRSDPTPDPVGAEKHAARGHSFCAGSGRVTRLPEPAYYSYTAPEPQGLRADTKLPAAAMWDERVGGLLAIIPYDAVRL